MREVRLDVHGPTMDEVVLTLSDPPKLSARAGYEEVTCDPDPVTVRELVVAIEKLRVSVTPLTSSMGLDGVTYQLRFSAGFTAIEYSWWSDLPENWEPLMEIAQRLIALSGLRIPAMKGY